MGMEKQGTKNKMAVEAKGGLGTRGN